MPSHPDRVRKNYEEDNRLRCPNCKSDKIIHIYRPEVYEYKYICRVCSFGFE